MKLDFSLGDVEPLPAGDLFTTQYADTVLQDVWLRLVTPKGDLWAHPDYGINIYDYLHLESTMTNRMALCMAIREEVRKDPRIEPESVDAQVAVWNSHTHELKINLSFTIVGQTNRYDLVIGYDLNEFGRLAMYGDGSDG